GSGNDRLEQPSLFDTGGHLTSPSRTRERTAVVVRRTLYLARGGHTCELSRSGHRVTLWHRTVAESCANTRGQTGGQTRGQTPVVQGPSRRFGLRSLQLRFHLFSFSRSLSHTSFIIYRNQRRTGLLRRSTVLGQPREEPVHARAAHRGLQATCPRPPASPG